MASLRNTVVIRWPGQVESGRGGHGAQGGAVVKGNAAGHRDGRDHTVHGSAIEVAPPESAGKTLGERALAGSDGTVDTDHRRRSPASSVGS